MVRLVLFTQSIANTGGTLHLRGIRTIISAEQYPTLLSTEKLYIPK